MQSKQRLIQMAFAQGVFLVYALAFAWISTWFGILFVCFGCIPICALYAVPMTKLLRRHGKSKEPPGLNYMIGLTVLLIPALICFHMLFVRLQRVHDFKAVEFRTTEELAEFYENSDPKTRRHTAIYLPDLAPVPTNDWGHPTGIFGVSTHTSRQPRSGVITTTYRSAWPIFVHSEAPEADATEIPVYIWETESGSISATKLRDATNWFQFESGSHYKDAVLKALEKPEAANIITNAGKPIAVETIRPLADEKRFWNKFFWIVFIVFNLFPLGIWVIAWWRNRRNKMA